MRFVAIVAIVLMAVLVVGACAKKVPEVIPGSPEAEARKALLPPSITEKAGGPTGAVKPGLAAPAPAAPGAAAPRPMAPMPGKSPGGAQPLVPGPG